MTIVPAGTPDSQLQLDLRHEDGENNSTKTVIFTTSQNGWDASNNAHSLIVILAANQADWVEQHPVIHKL